MYWLLHKTRGAYQKKPVKDVLKMFLFSCRNNQLLRFSLKNSISELRKEDWTFVAILTHSSFALKKSWIWRGFAGCELHRWSQWLCTLTLDLRLRYSFTLSKHAKTWSQSLCRKKANVPTPEQRYSIKPPTEGMDFAVKSPTIARTPPPPPPHGW